MAVLLSMVFASACARVRYRYVSSATANPHSENCDIKILTVLPQSGYEEIGFLEFDFATYNTADFLQAVGPQVCAAGGDAVVTQINNGGQILRGVVLKKSPQ